MSRDRFRALVEDLLDKAEITVDGPNRWDIQVKDPRLFRRVLTKGELGLGEAYMDGWWEADQLDEFIARVLRARLDREVRRSWSTLMTVVMARTLNLQSRRRAFEIGERHYDRGNELFRNMLDARMNYSCAYWEDAYSLDEAQEQKLELICQKLELEPGMRVLDIGCGWGAFGRYAAERYGVEVLGVTVSKEQVELGRRLCEGLPVQFEIMDYRDLEGTFDRIVSIGMIEHVGYKNYRTYLEVAHRCLADDGLFLLHTIGGNRSATSTEPWTQRYIFPNGMLPSIAQLGPAMEDLFVMEDWHGFGAHYDRTLLAWHENFTSNWHRIREQYDERFYRMWRFYLLSSAGAFRARHIQLWQIVLSRHGVPGGYRSIRRLSRAEAWA
ncbi:MAG: cyclopropane fatty acyl phospholipid synthase [Gemmatimonadota bacterium]